MSVPAREKLARAQGRGLIQQTPQPDNLIGYAKRKMVSEMGIVLPSNAVANLG